MLHSDYFESMSMPIQFVLIFLEMYIDENCTESQQCDDLILGDCIGGICKCKDEDDHFVFPRCWKGVSEFFFQFQICIKCMLLINTDEKICRVGSKLQGRGRVYFK